MRNAPFAIDESPYNLPANVLTVTPVHRFYQNRMQINHGNNDMFVAWTDVGSLVMGHYNPEGTYLYKLAKEFTLTSSSWPPLAAPTSTISGSPAPARLSTRTRR
jgi:phospholipase C